MCARGWGCPPDVIVLAMLRASSRSFSTAVKGKQALFLGLDCSTQVGCGEGMDSRPLRSPRCESCPCVPVRRD